MTLYRVMLHDGTMAYTRTPPRPPPPLPHDERRKLWIWHWKREARRLRFWTRHNMMGPFYPKPLPAACRRLICGARTRA